MILPDPSKYPKGSKERAEAAAQILRAVLPCSVISTKHHPGLGSIQPHHYVEVDP